MKTKNSENTKLEALTMRAQGDTVEEIVERTGLNAQEVVDLIIQAGEQLVTLQGIRQETTLKRHRATREDRLIRLATLRDRVQDELDRRDFADIPTEKLPLLLLKINEAMRDEVTPPQILGYSASNFGYVNISDNI